MAEYEIPEDLRYSSEDEWARASDGKVVLGITDYAQQSLGDIVFVELPALGTHVSAGANFGVIESVKAVSDLHAPVSGSVSEINNELGDAPERVNEDCYGQGWIIAISPSDKGEFDTLMESDAYLEFIAERED